MIGFSLQTKDEMLALFTSQAVSVGLFEGEMEIVDPRYTRLPVQFSVPLGEELRYIENVNEIRFDDMARDHTIDHWAVFDGMGQVRAFYKLVRPRDMPAEDNAVFRPGRLRVGLP